MNDSSTHYAFGAYQLNVKQRELRHNGALLSLRPKAFDMLALLVEQRSRIVSKDELLDQIWPNRYICETTLSACLKELRKTLGDSGRRQSIIKTIPRKGFRFVADLQVSAPTQTRSSTPVDEDSAADAGLIHPPVGPTWTTNRERKNVSVLRCGLVDSDNLAERLEPETLHYLLQDFFAIAQNVIACFDGQVTQWLGDGFVALFGVPVAYEDHARRALLAAYQLIERSQSLSQAKISFGLSSGEAIISSIPGQPQQYYTAHSEVLRLAETLQSQADSGCVLISLASHRLLRADVRVRALENDSDSARDGLVVEQIIQAHPGVPRRFRRHRAPLIGRDQALSLLQQCLRQAEQGQGQAVAITGAPGIGKSRLLREFQQALGHQNTRYLQANGFPHLHSTPYYLLAEILRQCSGISQGDPLSTVHIKLRACLQAAKLTEPDALPLMLKLLDLAHDTAMLDQFSAQAQRDKTAAYLQEVLFRHSPTTVLALEDVHWLDASSQVWLDSLIQHLADQRVLLMATYRPELNSDWLALPWVDSLVLEPLNPEQCQHLLGSLPHSIPQDRLTELAERSGGNPYFLEELVLNPEQSIPSTIQGVLMARIDQLQPDDKKLLQAAAIIGQRGRLKLLEAASDLDSEYLQSALRRLQDAELLFTDEAHFVFKHTLVQEVAYQHQLSDQRRSMHLRIANALQQNLSELAAKRPELLACHYAAAGRYENAIRGWQRAGHKAYERSAYSETITYAKQGLALLEHIDDPSVRAARELALLRTLGPALLSAHGYGVTEFEESSIRAKQLCEELQDHSALFRVLVGLSHYYLMTGDFARTFDSNRQILRLARQSYNNDLLLRARAAMGQLMLHCGRLRSAQRQLDQCLAIVSADQRPMLSSQATAVTAMGYAALVYWHLEQDSKALDCAEQALQRARASQQPFSLVIALCLSAELQRFRDNAGKALELAQEGVSMAQQQGFPYWHSSTLITLGWAKARSNEHEHGIATLQQGLSLFRSTGVKILLGSWLGALADAYQSAGQHALALSTIDEAIAWAEKIGDAYCLPQLFRLQKVIAK